ncbi:unnamed protein product (macronuclear) [Paramecium tetraurelia]|uniref:C3H1-type domain-containing protein n=1 Tax=Paramecium tetraurelia TaxID=5888 RepID=A0D8P3_PARTE|nr:uncharacterized protein GSPATT00014356001 [Paramecium tetraurelia]CAK79410.1 unnamed protein product [Paramecium tetraurelia]|eukprot:XP_001446807.1 hypothetical protein (macronuclear) [Paramecium tetraurelia strain d4-2]
MQSQKICIYFLRNKCNKGDQCPFKHDNTEAEKYQKSFQQLKNRIPDGYKQQNNQRDDQQSRTQNQFRFDGLKQRQQQNNTNNNPFQRDRQQNDFQGRQQNDIQGRQQQDTQGRQQQDNQGRQQSDNQGRQQNDNQGRQFNFNQDRQNNQGRQQYQGRDQNMFQNNRDQKFNQPNNESNNNQQKYQNFRQFNQQNNESNSNTFQQPRRFNQRPENEDQQNNRFQSNTQNYQQRNDYRYQNTRQNHNEFQNNARQLECENKILTQIQTLEISDFIQSIYDEEFKVLGIAKKNAIIFYRVNEQIDVNNKTQIQLPENTCYIYQIWSQVIDNQLVLIVCYQTKKISLRNIAIYPNLWFNYQHFTILDVSIKEIIYCKIQGSLCLVFSNDGNLRVYVIQKNAVIYPPRIYNFENPIESVLSIQNQNSEDTYYIGLQNGCLLTFNNGQFISIPHELNNQKFALVDIKHDIQNQQLFLLFWHLDEDLCYVLLLNLSTMIARQIYKQNMKISQIELIKEYVLCSNSLGIVDILKFDQNMYLSPYSYYPHQIEQSKTYNKISSFNKITLKNQNQVEIQLLLLGRTCPANQTQQNIELLYFN